MSWKPKPAPPAPLARVTCVEPGCSTTTEVEPTHAENLATCWRCREHYLRPDARRKATA